MRPLTFFSASALLAVCFGAVSCSTPQPAAVQAAAPVAAVPPPASPAAPWIAAPAPAVPAPKPKQTVIYKTDAQWRAQLTEQQYLVTRKGRTEAAHSGEYVNHKAPGTYGCVCCGAKLFSSSAKFDHSCGWPSFSAAEGNTATKPDRRDGMVRTEVICLMCEAHLGHLFNDGPQPGGKRYCINSVALKFEPKVKKKPEPPTKNKSAAPRNTSNGPLNPNSPDSMEGQPIGAAIGEAIGSPISNEEAAARYNRGYYTNPPRSDNLR